jgi:cellulose synthase/poly-beta-1,6-N-acetylglucosamine synthase-like glycosyltransferase
MIVVEIIQYFLAGGIGMLLGYQMFLSFLALKGRRIQDFSAEKNRKFAIVMPAYKEEKVIVKSLYSLSGLVYPKNMYDLIVIADNCTDSSVEIARNLGATVLECSSSSGNGEGSTLSWSLDHILKGDKKYDAIIVFDYNSLVSGNYLEVMNYYLEQGSKVIQSSGLVLSQPESWKNRVKRIEFLLSNFVKPMGRKVLGLGAGLRGNGMCFATEILKKVPWKTQLQNADFEYGLILQLKGVKIDFSPEATIWTQMPEKADGVESQRHQWQVGSYSTAKKYGLKLLAVAFRKKSVKYIDNFIDLITPPLVKLLLLVGLLVGINGLLVLFGWLPMTFLWIWLSIVGLGAIHLFLLGLIAASHRSEYTLPRKGNSNIEKMRQDKAKV